MTDHLHPTAIGSPRPTVVLLHSSAASARQWDALAARLRPGFVVHAIDLHGHGRQEPWHGERPLSVHDEAGLVLPLMERAGAAHLIGHSYGGAVALHLAAARPELVRSLAVYEPVLFSLLAEHDPLGAAAGEAFALGEQMRHLMAAGDAVTAAQRFVDYWAGAAAWTRMGPEQQRAVVARMATVVQHFDALFRAALPEVRLARLTMPTLCLTGGRSTPAALRIGELLRRLLPGKRHEILAGLSHMGPITHPSLVNGRLLDFHGVVETPTPATAESLA